MKKSKFTEEQIAFALKQIGLAFRDLKSHRYGQGMEDNLTRQGERLQILLLVSTLATLPAGLPDSAAKPAAWPTGWSRSVPDASSTPPCALVAKR